MLNEMMGDPEKDYVIHWWKFECDEFDFYSGYEWQVNCPKCKQRLKMLALDKGRAVVVKDSLGSAPCE